MAVTDKYVTADGLRTRYFEEGEGPSVLLLHGGATGSSADVWERTLPLLARDGRRVIAYDHPGYGYTDNPPDHSTGYRRDFILKFMDALGIEKAAIVGHSGSGGPSLEIALRHPDRISALLILGTGSLLPPLPGESAPPPPAGDEPSRHEPTVDDVRAVLEEQLFHHQLITPELVDRRLRVAVGKNYQASRDRRAAPRPAGQGTPLWQRLDEVSVPLIFIYGRQDRVDTPARVEGARQRYPRLEYHIVDDCRHLIQLDAEAEFVAIASRFLPSQATATVPAR